MTAPSRRLWHTLRDLALAMLNATLILVALCLFLGLRLANTVESVASTAAASLVSVDPLRQDIVTLTDEVAGLRTDLATVREGSADMTSEAARALIRKIDAVDARIAGMGAQLNTAGAAIADIFENPEDLIDHAIKSGAAEFAGLVTGLGLCRPGDGTPTLDAAPGQ